MVENNGKHAGRNTGRLKRLTKVQKIRTFIFTAITLAAAIVTIVIAPISVGANLVTIESGIEISTPIIEIPSVSPATEVSVEYINSNYKQEEDYWPLFSDRVDLDRSYQFPELCATQVIISNPLNVEIQLTSITYEATDIAINESIDVRVFEILTSEGIGLYVANHGWCGVEEATIVCTPENSQVVKNAGDKPIEVEFKNLGIAETRAIHLVDDKLAQKVPERELVDFIVDILGADGSSILDEQYKFSYMVLDGKFSPLGKGAPGKKVYAIAIDTSESSFTHTESIIESIQPRGKLSVPILFAVDRSCYFNSRIGFSFYGEGGSEEVWSGTTQLHFKVSSIYGTDFIDVTKASTDEMYSDAGDPLALYTYPFNKYQTYNELAQDAYVYQK